MKSCASGRKKLLLLLPPSGMLLVIEKKVASALAIRLVAGLQPEAAVARRRPP